MLLSRDVHLSHPLKTMQGLNVIATYVGVAQPYHTIRLMTAGPSGVDRGLPRGRGVKAPKATPPPPRNRQQVTDEPRSKKPGTTFHEILVG